MKLTTLKNYLLGHLPTHGVYDLSIQPESEPDTSNGWKISVQGRTVNHSRELIEKLVPLLHDMQVPFKLATAKRFALQASDRPDLKEQGTKAMTLYCPNGIEFDVLCQRVQEALAGYQGGDGIDTQISYQRHSPGLFIRCDRDASGNYITAH